MKNIYQNYDVLANAIIKQAYNDALYVKGNINSKDINRRNAAIRLKRENDLFINSEWFEDLCLLAKGENK